MGKPPLLKYHHLRRSPYRARNTLMGRHSPHPSDYSYIRWAKNPSRAPRPCRKCKGEGTVQRLGGGGGRGCNNFVPVLRGNGTKIAPTGDIFDQARGQMRSIRGKLADHVGDHVVSSPEGAILMTFAGTKSSYPRPPQSLNPSKAWCTAVYPCLSKVKRSSAVATRRHNWFEMSRSTDWHQYISLLRV